MLSWVVKVVPQPPELPSKNTEDAKEGKPEVAPPPAPEKKVTFEDECKKDAAKTDKLNQEVEAPAGNGPGPGMLTWISSTLPLPAPPANQSRANSAAKEEAAAAAASKTDDEKGMMAWISQGLEKVVPQPEPRSRESTAAEQQLQVQQAAAPAEAQSGGKEQAAGDQTAPPSMMDWIKHGIVKVVPQPESLPKTEGTTKSEAASKAPPAVPPTTTRPTSETESAKEAEQQPNMIIEDDLKGSPQIRGSGDDPVKRFLIDQIIWTTLAFPETFWIAVWLRDPARPCRHPDHSRSSGGRDPVDPVGSIVTDSSCLSVSGAQKTSDLVLEDLEEAQQQQEPQQEAQQQEAQQQEVKEADAAEPPTAADGVKKEAGDGAHMEERLQRLEAARVAEEMARQAAAEAVRQLEVERSAKIVIETLPESNDQLPNILEEENEDEPELENLQDDSEDSTENKGKPSEEKQTEQTELKRCLLDIRPAEDNPEAAAEEKQVEALAPPTAPEPADQVTPSSTDVEPASERRDLESPITQQPEPHLEEAPTHHAEQSEAAAAEEEAGGSGAPSVCFPIKSFLLRFPLAAECVERCRTLLQEHDLTPPTLSMPRLHPELAQHLSQLQKQAQQHCSSMASRFALLGFLSSLKLSVLQRRPPDT